MNVVVARAGVLDSVLPARQEIALHEGADIMTLIDLLDRRHGGRVKAEIFAGDQLREGCRIMVDGRHIGSRQGLATPLGDGSQVLFTVVISGG